MHGTWRAKHSSKLKLSSLTSDLGLDALFLAAAES